MTVSLEELQTSLASAVKYVEAHLRHAKSDVDQYIQSQGGLQAALAGLSSQVANAIAILTSLNQVLNIQNADMSLINKVYSAIQTIEKVVKLIESNMNVQSK